jgi:hypothetical protein
LAELKSAEADAWYAAAEMAMWSGNRKAKDLFGARRLLIAALIAAVVAAPFVLVAQPDDSLEETKLVPAPTPSPGFKVSDDDSVPHAAG